MPPDLDIGQVIIIVIAVVAGFLQWAWKAYQQSQEARKRGQPTTSEEEQRLREAAWQRQMGDEVPPRPSPTSTQPPHDPWSSLRDVFETVKEEMRKSQEDEEAPRPPPRPTVHRPPTPPPLPPPLARPIPVPFLASPPPLSAVPPAVVWSTRIMGQDSAGVGLSSTAAPMVVWSTPSSDRDEFAGLRALLSSPNAVRQAILLREILGPPKALQSSADTPQ